MAKIHPELKARGRVLKALLRPNKFFFHFYHWLSNRNPDAQIKGFDNNTVFLPSRHGNGSLRVRIYSPIPQEENLPVLLYLHGGGYALNSPEAAHREIRHLLMATPCVVVAPCYTKSVLAPYPAAIDDCEDALDWLIANAAELRINTDKLAIGGHSAGGGLTLALLLRLRDRGDVSVAFQMPIYPMIDHTSASDSARNNAMPVWNTKLNRLGWDLYLSSLPKLDSPPKDAAPAVESDYTGLPPALSFVGDLDPFLDETRAMVSRFKKAGVAIDYQEFPNCYHAFDLIVPTAEPSKKAIKFMQEGFRRAMEKYSAPQP